MSRFESWSPSQVFDSVRAEEQPKPTSLEVLGNGSGNVDGDSGRQAAEGGPNAQRDGAGKDGSAKEPQQGAAQDAKAKDAKPAAERKRTRNLSEDKRFKLFSGTANRPLAEEIGHHIGVPVGEAKMQRFADGEVYFQLLENVRGVDVFVVQPTCYPVDQHLVELLVMIDALKRASAARITVVVPYYGYARQDRKDRPRVAISAKLIADLLTTAGANRALVRRSARRADSGLLQYSCRSPLCQPGAGELFQGARSCPT